VREGLSLLYRAINITLHESYGGLSPRADGAGGRPFCLWTKAGFRGYKYVGLRNGLHPRGLYFIALPSCDLPLPEDERWPRYRGLRADER